MKTYKEWLKLRETLGPNLYDKMGEEDPEDRSARIGADSHTPQHTWEKDSDGWYFSGNDSGGMFMLPIRNRQKVYLYNRNGKLWSGINPPTVWAYELVQIEQIGPNKEDTEETPVQQEEFHAKGIEAAKGSVRLMLGLSR